MTPMLMVLFKVHRLGRMNLARSAAGGGGEQYCEGSKEVTERDVCNFVIGSAMGGRWSPSGLFVLGVSYLQ